MSVSRKEHWAMRTLAADATAAELAGVFREEGIPWLLLKGPAIARRLYDDGSQRPYSDVDALVRPRDYARAESLLTRLGYQPIPFSTRRDSEHASPWRRAKGAEIDLHRTFAHLPADRESVWHALSEGATTVDLAGEVVPVPSTPALALLVALHALHHEGAATRPMTDLERASTRLSEADWRAASDLAAELGAERNLAAALSLDDGLAALRATLGLPRVGSWEISLRSGENARLGAAVAALGGRSGLWAKTAAAYRALIPEGSVIETELRPHFGGSRAIRLRRAGRALSKLPVALLAWWVQRRDLPSRP